MSNQSLPTPVRELCDYRLQPPVQLLEIQSAGGPLVASSRGPDDAKTAAYDRTVEIEDRLRPQIVGRLTRWFVRGRSADGASRADTTQDGDEAA